MKTNLNLLFVLSIFSFIFSCRTTPENEKVDEINILTNNPVSVKINLSEIVFGNDNTENNLVAENNSRGGGNSLINNSLDTYTHYVDDYSFLEVKEITNTPQDNEYLSSLGLSSATKSENLPNGTKYTILAYKKIGNNFIYHKQEEFTVGDVNPKIELDSEQNYTLIIASKNKDIPLEIINEKDFNNAKFKYDRDDTNFSYQRIDNFIPKKKLNNEIHIKLKHRTTLARIIFDAREYFGSDIGGGKISSVKNSRITYKKADIINISGYPISYGYSISQNIDFSLEKINDYTVILSTDIFAKNISNVEFYIDIEIVGIPKKTINFTLRNIKQGYVQTFNARSSKCGAYLGKNKTNWRPFMCYNLGATGSGSQNPFEPNFNLWGDKYQWGAKNPIIKEDKDFDSYGEPNWNIRTIQIVWEEKDIPCPTSWRIPTHHEWRAVIDNNKITRLGTWKYSVDSGIMLGDKLMLPAAGRRLGRGSTDWDRPGAHYWTSFSSYFATTSLNIRKNSVALEDDFNSSYKQSHAMSVRCMRCIPDERGCHHRR